MSMRYMVSPHEFVSLRLGSLGSLPNVMRSISVEQDSPLPVPVSNYFKPSKRFDNIVLVSALILYASLCVTVMFLWSLAHDAHLTINVSS